MTVNEWLTSLLQQQELSNQELNSLNNLAEKIKGQLSNLPGHHRFYIAGSLAKGTIIKARYDLDIVMYWPFTLNLAFTLKDIYEKVGDVLKENYKYINQKTVSWEIPFEEGFHIDVVPGRALDQNYYEANLYRTDTKTRLKTSLKKHIDTVKKSGRIEVIRLLKLWREVNKVPLKKSFLLEIMAIEGCIGLAFQGNLKEQFYSALSYIRDNIKNCNFEDPANSNNSLCEDLTSTIRCEIYKKAYEAVRSVDERYWGQVFLNQF